MSYIYFGSSNLSCIASRPRSKLELCLKLLHVFLACPQTCSLRPVMTIARSAASMWFVKSYCLLMREDAKYSCCYMLCKTLLKLLQDFRHSANSSGVMWVINEISANAISIFCYIDDLLLFPQQHSVVWRHFLSVVSIILAWGRWRKRKLLINNSEFQHVVLCTVAACVFAEIGRYTLRGAGIFFYVLESLNKTNLAKWPRRAQQITNDSLHSLWFLKMTICA